MTLLSMKTSQIRQAKKGKGNKLYGSMNKVEVCSWCGHLLHESVKVIWGQALDPSRQAADLRACARLP